MLRALLDQARGLDRPLLLDNADLILQRLRNEHWALRETLQSEPRIPVFAASACAIEASYEYDAPFYDFFRIDELKRLQDQGVVERTAPYRDKRTLFQLAERFFNIWEAGVPAKAIFRRLTQDARGNS